MQVNLVDLTIFYHRLSRKLSKTSNCNLQMKSITVRSIFKGMISLQTTRPRDMMAKFAHSQIKQVFIISMTSTTKVRKQHLKMLLDFSGSLIREDSCQRWLIWGSILSSQFKLIQMNLKRKSFTTMARPKRSIFPNMLGYMMSTLVSCSGLTKANLHRNRIYLC